MRLPFEILKEQMIAMSYIKYLGTYAKVEVT